MSTEPRVAKKNLDPHWEQRSLPRFDLNRARSESSDGFAMSGHSFSTIDPVTSAAWWQVSQEIVMLVVGINVLKGSLRVAQGTGIHDSVYSRWKRSFCSDRGIGICF